LIILAVQKMKITWASSLILDLQLHRTTQIEILKNLAIMGNETRLIGMESRKRIKLETTEIGLTQIPVKSFPIISELVYLLFLALFLPIHMLRFDPDYVIMDPQLSIFGAVTGVFVSKIKKTKFVLDIRSTPTDVQGFLGTLHNFQFDVSVFFAKAFFSGISIITPMMKEEICRKYSIEQKKIGVWTSGVSESLFDPSIWSNSGKELRAQLGLSDNFIVFYHGNLSAIRGILEIVEATRILAKKQDNLVLFLLGSGPLVPKLKSLIKKENIEKNVIIHEAVSYGEVPKFISMSDICIIPLPDNPLWRSQSPLKLLEYLSMEKVVVATDIPAHRRVVGNSDCCLYLSSLDTEKIVELLEFAQINKAKLDDWGKLGRVIILKEYTWKKVAQDFQRFLNAIN
jgi:glycosyltransferase involved in cell wall biosynthesis